MDSLTHWEMSDYLTETPYAEIYAMRNDPFAHQAALERAAIEAGSRGFKTFKRMYKSYEARQKGKVAISVDGNVTEFSGQPMELETGLWRADDIGVSQGDDVACVHPIMPVQRLVNVDKIGRAHV